MLLESIFLVLLAIVLTILGVGMADMKKPRTFDELGRASVKYVKNIVDKSSGNVAAGLYDPAKDRTYIAKEIPRPAGDPYELTAREKEFVKYHEKFHELALKTGFIPEAEKEHYADLAAIYGLLIDADELSEFAEKLHSTGNANYARAVAASAIEKNQTAWAGINYLSKSGRIRALGDEDSINAVVKYISGKKLTAEENSRVRRGFVRTKNLIYAASGELDNYVVPPEKVNYTMSLEPVYKAGKSIAKEAWSYVDEIMKLYGLGKNYNEAKTDSAKDAAVKALGNEAKSFGLKKAKQYTGAGG